MAGILSTSAISRSALLSHPGIDIGSEQESVMKMLHALRSCTPYITKGSTLKDELEEDRQKLIDEYKQYVRSHFDTDEEYEEYMRKRKNGGK